MESGYDFRRGQDDTWPGLRFGEFFIVGREYFLVLLRYIPGDILFG